MRAPPAASREPRRAPELRVPYPLLDYLLRLPGDYAKLTLRLLQRAQWVPTVSQTGVPIDAGEVLLSLRSRDIWDAVELDRELDESGRVSLLRRVLTRLERDQIVAVRAAHDFDTRSGTRRNTRRDTPATVVRFLRFRDSLWPGRSDATRETTRGSTHDATHRIDTILTKNPANPASHCPVWDALARGLEQRLRRDLFEQWFAPLTASVDGEDLVLHAVDEFHQAFLEDNYRPFIDEELRRLVGDSTSSDRPRRLRITSLRGPAACN